MEELGKELGAAISEGLAGAIKNAIPSAIEQGVNVLVGAAVSALGNIVKNKEGNKMSNPNNTSTGDKLPFNLSTVNGQVEISAKENSTLKIAKPGFFTSSDWKATADYLTSLATNHEIKVAISVGEDEFMTISTLSPIQFSFKSPSPGLVFGESPDGAFMEIGEEFHFGPFKLAHLNVMAAYDPFTGTLDLRPMKKVGDQP